MMNGCIVEQLYHVHVRVTHPDNSTFCRTSAWLAWFVWSPFWPLSVMTLLVIRDNPRILIPQCFAAITSGTVDWKLHTERVSMTQALWRTMLLVKRNQSKIKYYLSPFPQNLRRQTGEICFPPCSRKLAQIQNSNIHLGALYPWRDSLSFSICKEGYQKWSNRLKWSNRVWRTYRKIQFLCTF